MPEIKKEEFFLEPHIRHINELGKDELRKYLKIYGSEDFEPNKGIEIPDVPTFLKVFNLTVKGVKIESRPGEFSDLKFHDVNVFFCHAGSNENMMWTADGKISIPELIDEFRKENSLVLSLTCNPGSFKLPNDIIYPIGKICPVCSCVNKKEGIYLDAYLAFWSENKAPVFHIPEKYLKK
jgi:hypothetical protein